MARVDVSVQSTEYVRVAVVAKEFGVRVDPTAGAVSMAFIERGDEDAGPVTEDWLDAEWETDNGTYYARCLIGPSGVATLTKGYYRIWLKLSATPETPVMAVGHLYAY